MITTSKGLEAFQKIITESMMMADSLVEGMNDTGKMNDQVTKIEYIDCEISKQKALKVLKKLRVPCVLKNTTLYVYPLCYGFCNNRKMWVYEFTEQLRIKGFKAKVVKDTF